MDKNSVVIVTGANAGIGKATVTELAKTGATVVMLCRSQARGEEALNEVRAISASSSIQLMICDLGSQQSIEDFCTEFKKRYQRLDVLVNNAGVFPPDRQQTVDGYELQFGINHLGHFLLTNRLLELLIASGPARIINLTSGIHKAGKINFEDVNLKKNYKSWRAYAQSKLANILFTYELAERLKGTGVAVNCVHPGAVATGMGINNDSVFGNLFGQILKTFQKTPEQGAETAVYVATSHDVEGVTAKYFYRKRPIQSSKGSYNKADAIRLWDLSEKMTGLKK